MPGGECLGETETVTRFFALVNSFPGRTASTRPGSVYVRPKKSDLSRGGRIPIQLFSESKQPAKFAELYFWHKSLPGNENR